MSFTKYPSDSVAQGCKSHVILGNFTATIYLKFLGLRLFRYLCSVQSKKLLEFYSFQIDHFLHSYHKEYSEPRAFFSYVVVFILESIHFSKHVTRILHSLIYCAQFLNCLIFTHSDITTPAVVGFVSLTLKIPINKTNSN